MIGLDEGTADQFARTLLAWRRTALSLVAAGLLVAHLAAADAGSAALAATFTGTAAVVLFVWLSSRDRRIAESGLALVVGVLLLGVVIMVGVASG